MALLTVARQEFVSSAWQILICVAACLVATGCRSDNRVVEYATWLQERCHAGNGERCTELGGIYDRGDKVARDDARATALYALGCKHGDSWGCVNYGMSLEGGLGTAKDVDAAVTLYRGACDAGNADGCFKLAALYEGLGPKEYREPVEAVKYYSRACGHGLAHGCTRLAHLYRAGASTAGRDLAEVTHLYEVACNERDPIACLELARMYEAGEAVPPAPGRSEGLVHQATSELDQECERGESGQCLLLGVIYDVGYVILQNYELATYYYGRSCDLGSPVACAWAAVEAERPEGGATLGDE